MIMASDNENSMGLRRFLWGALAMGLRPIPRQGMDPLDLLYGPRLDAVGIQSRAKK
jgi:hypothetical protein